MINEEIVNQDLTPQGYIYKDMVKHPLWNEEEKPVKKDKKEESK